MKITQILKRDGVWELFQPAKLVASIHAALKPKEQPKAKKLAEQVVQLLEKQFTIAPTAQDVQDVVEEILTKNKLLDAVKAYHSYRLTNKVKEFRTYHGVRDDLGLSSNAITVLADRYLLRNDEGAVVETPSRLFRRVAKVIAHVDRTYDQKSNTQKTEEKFYQSLSSLEFLPNTPTLMNAGTHAGQLSSCFVLPVGDSLSDIFESVKTMALVHQSGGSTGFSFSHLRPKNSLIKSTKGHSSGPLSFLRVFDVATDVIKQGSKRKGANTAVLRIDHPDILDFINAKLREGAFSHINFNVAVTDDFLKAVEKNQEYSLIDPHTHKETGKLNAKTVFDLLAHNAWMTGEPGLLFIESINRANQTSALGNIESTSGEQPLHPFESCTLGSINVSKFVKHGKPEWERLTETIKLAIHFLDNSIDANKYALPQIEAVTKANRRIGLGIMGFAEMLIKLGLPYDSPKALEFAEKLMKFINDEARKTSTESSVKRGSFPNFSLSSWTKDKRTLKGTRNATVTAIAQTGTISALTNATSGIEPLFAVAFLRDVANGMHVLEVNPVFEEIAREKEFYSKALMLKIAHKGSVQGLKEVPKDVQRLFMASSDIVPEAHIKMQAAFQKHCDSTIGKTINLPEKSTVEDVKKAYLLSHKLNCKNVTIFRNGSKKGHVTTVGKIKEEKLAVSTEYSGGSPTECSY